MRIFLIILLLIIVVALAFLFFYSIYKKPLPAAQQNLSSSVCFKDNCFQVELAKTNAEQERGLMYRTELDKNEGMLFIFDKEGVYPFWMKNTLIPLDITWIDSSNKVVFISQDVQPCKSLICPSVFPRGVAKYVLEINAGLCQDMGLKLGDIAELKIK
jgi:uncharacterized membrane protein (UPF0127 family)